MTTRTRMLVPGIATVAALLLAVPDDAAAQVRACCTITALDAQAGTATARDNASGNVFEFRARAPALLASLRVGQAVHANFATNRVSLDGRVVCCAITKLPTTVEATPQPAPPRAGAIGARGPAGARGTAGAGSAGAGVATNVAVRANLKSYPLPQVTFGEPVAASSRAETKAGRLGRVETRVVDVKVGGRQMRRSMVHVRGSEGIRGSNLPDGAKRLLDMHVRKLKQNESQYYLVDEELARQWAATHEVPPEYKPKEEKKEDDSDCGTISWQGVQDCASDATEAINDELARTRERAEDWWEDSAESLAEKWNETVNCFADHRLPGPKVPVRFATTKSMSMSMKDTASSKGAKGEVSGSLTLGIPVQGDFEAGMDFLYVPCLPFVFRPSRVSADGELTVGHQVAVEVAASGAFSRRFTIPPTGGPQILLYVIPIVIGNVPVAVLDVSLYIEGEVDVKGEGKASGRFGVTNMHTSKFEFACDGSGCDGKPNGSSAPAMTEESAQIEGRVSVQPGLFVALQLSFDYNVLQGRAGLQPYLLGYANGCIAGSVTQAGGGTNITASNVLAADLDWGVKLRAEALSGGQKIGKRYEKKVMSDRHVWFKDLAPGGSTALAPVVTIASQANPGQPTTVMVQMPTCYPYDDELTYRIAWNGGAIPEALASCQWQQASGVCRFLPRAPLTLRFNWPAAGAHSIAVQAYRDEHRLFTPTPQPTRVTVNVGVAGGGGGTP
jgi:hypothetical protein